MDATQRLLLLSDVRADIKAAEKELAELRRIEAYLARPVRVPAANPPVPTYPPERTDGGATARSRPREEEAVEDVLRRRGPSAPMGMAAIAKELVNSYGFPQKEQEGRLLEKKLHRLMRKHDDLFVQLETGLWTLREFADPADSRNGFSGGQGSHDQSGRASQPV